MRNHTDILKVPMPRISINSPREDNFNPYIATTGAAYLHLVAIFLKSERVEVSNRAVPIGRRVLDAKELTLKPILLRFRNVRRMVDILDEVPLAELVSLVQGS
jgi:hypothetical protein